MRKNIFVGAGIVAVAFLLAFGSTTLANHSWGGYHWARTANPFTLQLGDNVSGVWDTHLRTASSDWSASTVLDTSVVSGFTNPKICRATNGRVEVCNSKYGNNGWLGIAQIWVDGSGHITKGATKLNDTYFNTAKYNTPAWRNLVMCQEIAHAFGLDHQDENFSNTNLGSCMDYTNNPESNQHPNAHDFEQLATIYGHVDSFTSASKTAASSPAFGNVNSDNPNEWGQAMRRDAHGKPSLFRRDLGGGESVYTFVIWAE